MRLSTFVPVVPIEPVQVPLPTRRVMRLGAVFSVVVLLLFVIDGWAPRVLQTFAARSASTPASHHARVHRDDGLQKAEAAGVNVDGAVERASHTPMHVAGRAGALEVSDNAYRARFDHQGFSYAPVGAATSFNVSVSSIQRGGSMLALRSGPWTAQPGAAMRELAPGVSERVSTRSGEVEWDVALATPPTGSGDLRITAGLTGTTGVPTRVRGDNGPAWRFQLDGGRQVQLGEIVVKDASGAVLYRALPEVANGHVSLVVPTSVLDGAAYPLTVDPTVKGPFPVSDTGFNPSVAFSGDDYLVVWEQQFGGDGDILGARVNGAGAVVSGPFLISSSSLNESHADIAWNGSTFLVVWEIRNNGAPPLDDYDLRGQRLTATGGLLGSNFSVYGGSYSNKRFDSRHPSVASNNVDFFVSWDDNVNYSVLGWDIYGKTITRNGVVGLATRYAEGAKSETSPDVAWNGGTYLITYTYEYSSTDHDIYGQQVSPFAGFVLSDGTFNGQAYGSIRVISGPTSEQLGAGVASEGYLDLPCDSCADPPASGKPFLVAWTDLRNGTADVFGGRVDALGNVLNGSGFPINTGPRGQAPGPKTVAFNGVYLVAWVDIGDIEPYPRGIYAARVDKNGTVLDGSGFKVADTSRIEQSPAVSRGPGNQWGVAYEDYPGSGGATIGLRTVSPK